MGNEQSEAFEIITSDAQSPILLFCDHASNRVPKSVAGGDLGLPPEDMNRHIAFDIGARGVTHHLARHFSAHAILSRFSRLVIDPNRAEDDPTLIMQLYDGSIIPANRHVDETERQSRLSNYHRPYHDAAADVIDRMHETSDRKPMLISIHSFTPKLRAGPMRPWHIGILHAADTRLSNAVMHELNTETDVVFGANVPYTGALVGDCMATHGISRGLPHVLIEIRNDLIADAAGEKEWADRLAGPLLRSMDSVWEKEANANG